METAVFNDELSRERRARLAAERLLEQKQAELKNANRKLSQHALSLSDQIVDQRKVVAELEGQNSQVHEDLEKANVKVTEVERLLWDALESIPDGFALFDKDLKLIAANHPYLSVIDHAEHVGPGVSYESILDLCLEEGLVDLEGKDEDEWYDFMLDRWAAPNIEPVTLRFWNGMYVKLVDRRTADGGIVSLALNITDTIRREDELRDARDKAQAADRAKSSFLARMSHELRTPMNGVVGMAELLMANDLDEESTLYASTIKGSGEALLEIINDVLDFSKIEADKIELKPVPFDLERVVQEVALIVEPTVQQKQITLDVDYDQFLPTTFVGDRGRLRQILTNLVGNAVKFTDQGHVLIRVVGLPLENDEFQLHITVEDTGIGIDEDMVDHIFGEFNQVEDQANRKFEGTGLGLAITRRLVEHMGGEVWIDSVKGEGSAFGFMLTLPLAKDSRDDETQLPEHLQHILLAGPKSVDQSVLARQIRLLGRSTQSVETLDAALEIIEESPPDLVILSQPKPIDGTPDPVETLRSAAPDLPVILMPSSPGQADESNHPYILRKPILRHDLFSVLLTASGKTPTNSEAPEPPETDRTLQVLAAEDNKTNQLVFRKMLKDIELDLKIVGNGREAVDAFSAHRPDMIFMDISMPEMDGMEATNAIRALERKSGFEAVPIIAMTAHAVDGDEARIREAGVDHYLTKPLKREAIHKLIHALTPPDLSGTAAPRKALSEEG
ncbi:MAG: response regulator [Litoreibacter sp.]|nr:response regulator [Litoreibacter sp.]